MSRHADRYETKISLILLDIVMPGMNGFGVLEYMNRNNLIGDIPVIMISGEDSGEVIKQAYEWEFLIISSARSIWRLYTGVS